MTVLYHKEHEGNTLRQDMCANRFGHTLQEQRE